MEKGVYLGSSSKLYTEEDDESRHYYNNNVPLLLRYFNSNVKHIEDTEIEVEYMWIPTVKSIDFYIGDSVENFYKDGNLDAVQIYNPLDSKECE